MNRNTVLEAMYKVIKDSTEWGINCEDASYGQFVDGVMAMTEAMLTEAEIEERCAKLEKLDNKLRAFCDDEYSKNLEAAVAEPDVTTTTSEVSKLDISELYNTKNYEPVNKK